MIARLAWLAVSAALMAGVPALAQAPSPTTPPDKIAPDPIQRPPGAGERTEGPDAGDTIGVPAKVWAVRIAGGWAADGKRGFSRVIGAFEGDAQRLTVQWLAEPDGRVVDSKVLEDPEAAKLTFGDMRAEPDDSGGVTVFLDTLPDADGIRDTWVLILEGPGEARFGPATN